MNNVLSKLLKVKLALFKTLLWRSGSVMARGSIPGGNGVKTELHVLRKGQ